MTEMTEAQRKWRDENMEAICEGVKAVKEGRITPADTFFEWMQAKYVRDIWEQKIADLEAENARLQDGYDGLKCQYDEEHAELLGYKALAERRREALERMMGGFSHGGEQTKCPCPLCREARAAIDALPEQAREKARR